MYSGWLLMGSLNILQPSVDPPLARTVMVENWLKVLTRLPTIFNCLITQWPIFFMRGLSGLSVEKNAETDGIPPILVKKNYILLSSKNSWNPI